MSITFSNRFAQTTQNDWTVTVRCTPKAFEEQLKKDFCSINQELYSIQQNRPTFNDARFFLNSPKNRYRNILPPDQTRVQLPGEHPTNYINASYIRGYGSIPKQYISAQAPLCNLRANTLQDWWTMIESENIKIIFMLTRLVEKGKTKACPYWPKTIGGTKKYGHYTVCLELQNTRTETIIERTFQVVNTITGKQRCVLQVHYTGWPDFGTPSSLHEFKELIRYMDDFASTPTQQKSPILVHCSAGVGRSGTLIASHFAWQALNAQRTEEQINIREIVKQLRKDRTGMVQCFSQYLFLHSVVQELCEEAEPSRSHFPSSHNSSSLSQSCHSAGLHSSDVVFSKVVAMDFDSNLNLSCNHSVT
eukprot:TRINITY_DN18101_c0_g1_i1.p1 TRINITY_DN18101_c0_g1~~TRINITY_DN18101_c0_g1_i1.p1  ORF type:complete len:362 (-),score=13.39 TRINITY_DN18101_c0_g1_i1:19-1104(-)